MGIPNGSDGPSLGSGVRPFRLELVRIVIGHRGLWTVGRRSKPRPSNKMRLPPPQARGGQKKDMTNRRRAASAKLGASPERIEDKVDKSC